MTFCLAAAALAQEAGKTAAPAAKPQVGPPGGIQQMVLTIGLLILIFYFVILRPQKTEQRKREELLSSVAKGDSVITTAGIYGTVESVDAAKGTVTINVAPKVSMKFSRAAITNVIEKKRGGKEAESEASAS